MSIVGQAIGESFQGKQYAEHLPSAIISDGIVPVSLWAVTQMTLTETYHCRRSARPR